MIYCWPLNNMGVRGVNPPHSQKSTCNLQLVLCIHMFSTTAYSANHGSYSIVVIIIEKNPPISEPTQFKLMLYKGLLCVFIYTHIYIYIHTYKYFIYLQNVPMKQMYIMKYN